ncbi:putative F-box protein At3g16210 [Gastrolobium bilobum]|uniref:putative F-box protein At3g16210 n=1 Tax=Gastrolobium bilobum TaxID=150636 RepID=UPI002AB2AB0D|nr:putative F-box protein At3g16210 [Gastrolobium bilobum]
MEKLGKRVTPTNEKVSNNIPDDLALSILLKLPMKSLNRFRCVHKSWSNLLENPQFMRMYYQNFISKDDDQVLLVNDNNLFMLSGERYEKKVKLDWPMPFLEGNNYISIFGPCINGTICLLQGNYFTQNIILWNPTIEEFKVIPSGLIHSPGIDFITIVNGFGYDHLGDDYKLIRYVIGCKSNVFEPIMEQENQVNIPKSCWQIYN